MERKLRHEFRVSKLVFDQNVLEHFNIFCSALWRREDKADKEEYVAILKYCK